MIFGHQKNLKLISTIIEEKKFPHAVLFTGPDGIGKRDIALEIAKYLSSLHQENFFNFTQKKCSCQNCQLIDNKNFPEIIEIKKTDTQILIKEIREIKKKLSTSSMSPYRIIILNNVEKLSQEATGALLKILEEPRGKTIFFLLSSMPGILPKTIISRLSVFKFDLLTKKEIQDFINNFNIQISLSEKEKIVDLALGRVKIAEEFLFDKKKLLSYDLILKEVINSCHMSVFERINLAQKIEKNNQIEDFIFLAHFWFRDLFLVKNNILDVNFEFQKNNIKKIAEKFSGDRLKQILKTILITKKYIYFSNASNLLALENFLIRI